MPAVELSREEAAQGDLPRVCVCCGEAATTFHRMVGYDWFGRKLGKLLGPLCKSHQYHWRRRAIVFNLFLISIGVSFAVALPLFMWELSRNRIGVGLILIVGLSYLAIPVLVIVHTALYFISVHITRATKTTLTLVGVAPGFIEALRVYRQAKMANTPIPEPSAPFAPDERCSDTVLQVLDLAIQEAQRLHQDHLGTAFLLFGLSESVAGVAVHILRYCSISRERLRIEIKRLALMGANIQLEKQLPWTPALKRVLLNAIAEADRAKRKLADEGHLLLALLQEEEGEAAQILIDLGANLEDLRRKAHWLLRANNEGIQVLGVHRQSIQSSGGD